MPEHPEAPDRIPDRIQLPRSEVAYLTDREIEDDVTYLRLTPARAAAEQMLEALRVGYEFMGRGNSAKEENAERMMAVAIAAAEGGEE